MRGIGTGRVVDCILLLALKVLGEHRMDGAAMHMALAPMGMIRFGMDMDERNDEHPEGRPEQDQQTGARRFVAELFHR